MAGITIDERTKLQSWKPEFDRWRHGGWYVSNITYPSGAVGCVSNNYPDKKWRIVAADDVGTFSTRTEAAHAERAMVLAEYLNIIARRLDESAMSEGAPPHELCSLRDFALTAIHGEQQEIKDNEPKYFTWAHNIEGCLRNGSFVRKYPDRIVQYMNGDYMGVIDVIPDGMTEVHTERAGRLIPKCCR